jgi:hypothetical protein
MGQRSGSAAASRWSASGRRVTTSVLDDWIDAPKGSFVLVPAGITHDFENRCATPAGVLNFSHPGDFEQHAGHRPVVHRQSRR